MNFSNLKDWFIETGKLNSLGFTDDHLHFAFGLIAILLFYYIFSPIFRWLMYLKWNKVITYLFGSFALLFICTFIELYQGINGTGNMEFSDIASATLAIFLFGIFLLISHISSAVITQLKQKNRRGIQQHQKI